MGSRATARVRACCRSCCRNRTRCASRWEGRRNLRPEEASDGRLAVRRPRGPSGGWWWARAGVCAAGASVWMEAKTAI
eukprot:3035871-Pleurochrysis_carterae.AAC.1